MSQYYWIRVFDYIHSRDDSRAFPFDDKGVLLDEFYLNDAADREEAKKKVKEKYADMPIAFAKPKKKDGIYAIVMASSKFFYDRFYLTIDTYCFHCHKPIKGKMAEFPKMDDSNGDEYLYFCSWECKRQVHNQINPSFEGEFQSKEAGASGNVFGYIYLIYNKVEDSYYVGQTRFLPFFRWQEHIKSGSKGDIKDLSFSVITEVARDYKKTNDEHQIYLNSIEAWWISKFKEEGYNVINVASPKITIEYLKEKFDEMISNEKQLKMNLMEVVECQTKDNKY